MQKYNIIELNEKELPDLQKIAEELGISKVSELDKQALVYRILDEQAIVLAEENKKEPKKPEGRKRGRPAKAKGAPEKPAEEPAEGEPVAAAEQPVEAEKAVETPDPAQPKPSKKRKTRVAAVPVVTVDPNQPVTEPIPEPMPALRDKEEPQAPQGKVEQPLLNEPAAVEVKDELAQSEEELVFSDTLVTAEVEPMAVAGAPEEKAVEEDRRRLVSVIRMRNQFWIRFCLFSQPRQSRNNSCRIRITTITIRITTIRTQLPTMVMQPMRSRRRKPTILMGS